MRIVRRKKSYCQNCQYPLLENYNFCPNCGQENSEKMVSFGTLTGEFFSNYIAYDSKLGRTIRPFLFKPGYLTNEFIAGRRTKYMHPLRLYFIVSFFYFLILSFLLSQDNNTNVTVPVANNPSLNSDSLQTQMMDDVSKSLTDSGINVDSLDRITSEARNGLEIDLSEEEDSASTVKAEKWANKLTKIVQLIKKEGISADQVLDSVQVEKNFIKLRLVNQAIKLNQQGSGAFLNYFISKVSLMMFVILPVSALILKLFYVRKKRYYVEHITFTLNVHSFMFLLFSFAFLLMQFSDTTDGLIGLALFLILVFYIAMSFKRVYKQSWVKTMIKMFFLFISYMFTLTVSLIITIIISVLLF